MQRSPNAGCRCRPPRGNANSETGARGESNLGKRRAAAIEMAADINSRCTFAACSPCTAVTPVAAREFRPRKSARMYYALQSRSRCVCVDAFPDVRIPRVGVLHCTVQYCRIPPRFTWYKYCCSGSADEQIHARTFTRRICPRTFAVRRASCARWVRLQSTERPPAALELRSCA